MRVRRIRLVVAGLWVVLLMALAPVSASSPNVSHSYSSESPVPLGSIVSLDKSKSDTVTLSNIDNAIRLIGVAVQSDDSLVAVDPETNKVQVATSGTADALVSTLNGNIKVGDQVAASPFNGIGMKAEPGSHVIGVAQTDLTADSEGAKDTVVKDKQGNEKHIKVGFVKVSLAVGETVSAQGVELNSLQKLAKSWTGHTVSTARIIIAMVIAVVASVALVTLVYASIFGSIISIGRNPLAKQTVFRSLGSVLFMALLIAVTATATIFLLLR